MPWMKLKFAPGINKDSTRYSADGTWYDGNLVRFRNGLPEAWRGWRKTQNEFEFQGICRSMHRWSDLSGFNWVSFGTNTHFYVVADDDINDVTPYDDTSLGSNPFAATDTSKIVTVTHTAHGLFQGNRVSFSGATTFAGISAVNLNTEFLIKEIVDADSYKIEVATAATSTASGGGGSVVERAYYTAGSTDYVTGGGWGSLAWGEEEWGGDSTLGQYDRMGIWSQDNWGEDLVANAQGGPIFYWDATNPDDAMVNILDLNDADSNAPAESNFIVVSHVDRHLLAFGATEFGTSVVAPMSVRWCSQEDILDWDEASLTGTAGSLPLSNGSKFISAVATQSEIVVWSDTSIYSIRYIGSPYIYTATLLDGQSDIVGLKASCVFEGVVYWMGKSGIYTYSGRVEQIYCPVWDYLVNRINWGQSPKVVVRTNKLYGEILFLYQSVDSISDVDSYLCYDVRQQIWTIGTLDRTYWLDQDSFNNSLAPGSDGFVYEHEVGATNGEDGTAIDSYIESAPIEISSEGSYDKGDRFMFIRRILPDVTFRNYTGETAAPSMNIVLKMMDKPGGTSTGLFMKTSSSQVARQFTIPVEEFTEECHVRLRGRALVLRAESTTEPGAQWRLGVPRIDVRPDGQK